MTQIYPGLRVRAHVEPNHGGKDYGPGVVVEVYPGIIERARVKLDSGDVTRFNTRWLSALVEPGSHRERYPEQYSHPLIGKLVALIGKDGKQQARGVVERVTSTRWGELVHLVDGGDTWWLASACREVAPGEGA